MESKEFYIDQDGFKLHAKLDFPKSAKEKMPLVILVHGLTGHMEEEHIIAASQAITEVGMACLRVEMYGHGKSDGEFKNHNVMIWVNELLYVISYAKKLDFVTDLFLAGHSQGGLTIMLTAALAADKLKAIMPLSPATVIKESCANGNFFGHRFNWEEIPEELHFWDNAMVTDNYVRIGRILPIDEAIAGFNKPVCIIHGTADTSVPVSYGMEADSKYKNSKLVLIKDADHCYVNHLEEMSEAIKEFLNTFSD